MHSKVIRCKTSTGHDLIRTVGCTRALTPLMAIHHKLEVYAMSDLHTDHPTNMQWVQRHCREYREDPSNVRVLIVAGDVSDDLTTLVNTLRLLKTCYSRVLFVPGNHELWVSSSDTCLDSVVKLGQVLTECSQLGIETGPCSLGPRLIILPLHSWHHSSFDQEREVLGVPRASPFTIADYAKTKWPSWINSFESKEETIAHGSTSIAIWADSLNNQHIKPLPTTSDCQQDPFVLSFSHFVPSQRLVPEKRYLTYPNLVKAVGSELLRKRIDAIRPNIHVFGHHHFSWDMKIEDTRYISAPLCYPRERGFRMKSIAMSSPWQQEDDDELILPLLIYRARFTSGGKNDDISTEAASTPYKDLLGMRVIDWEGEECPFPLGGAMWSKYYRTTARDPDNVEMAPWVKERYLKRLQRLSDSGSHSDIVKNP